VSINITPSAGPTGAAISFVNEGWGFFEAKAELFTSRTLALISELSFVPNVQPIAFHVDFPEITGLTAFVAPPRPTLPDITFSPIAIPDVPDLVLPSEPAYTAQPVFDVDKPTPISLPAQPSAFDIATPGPAPALSVLTLPPVPVLNLPVFPAFLTIKIPDVPPINLPTFGGIDPGAAPAPPSLAGVGFSEVPYTRAVLDDVIPQVRRALAGGTGLSAMVEGAIFQRARERTDRVSRKARQEVAEEYSGRGFTEPPGSFAMRMAEKTQDGQDAANDTNRAITVQFHDAEIKNIQFAVTQGIALEQILIGQQSQVMDRSLQGAKLLLDARVAIHNAEVAAYNSSIDKFRANADVYKTRIEGEISKLEAYKAQIDGQKAIADINKSAADAYDSQVRGVLGLVEIYKSQVQAVEVQAGIDKTRIESYAAVIQGYAEQVRAFDSRWGAYKTAVEAQEAGFRTYEIGVNAYAARIQGWGKGEEIKSGRYETGLKGSGLRLEAYGKRVTQAQAQLQVELGRINALGTKTDALARMYSADAQIETARTDSNTRAFEANVAYQNNRTQVQLREAEIKIQDAQRVLAAQLEAIKGAAAALAQLAASAMSAVNFSAGVSGSGSEGTSFSYSESKGLGWNWSGETADNNNPPVF
jgi:hypothetical protein